MTDYLLFVDTNILLDFYRVRNESGLTLLNVFDSIRDRLICTYQVEMEFKKNRQAVIVESLKNLKAREKVPHAAFLAESKSAEVLNRRLEEANKRIARFRARLGKVLANPTGSDPVYKVVQRLFTHPGPFNLLRESPERRAVKRRAFRRFILGYPPRKKEDTSMGDALNWEWIVDVAKTSGQNILLVSRDSDYGVELDGKTYVNDWLLQEFRDRVSKKRQCRIFNRLAPAYKVAGISVTRDAERQEEEELERKRSLEPRLTWPEIGGKNWVKTFERLIHERAAAATEPPDEA